MASYWTIGVEHILPWAGLAGKDGVAMVSQWSVANASISILARWSKLCASEARESATGQSRLINNVLAPLWLLQVPSSSGRGSVIYSS